MMFSDFNHLTSERSAQEWQKQWRKKAGIFEDYGAFCQSLSAAIFESGAQRVFLLQQDRSLSFSLGF